jgi:hypothetical protein
MTPSRRGYLEDANGERTPSQLSARKIPHAKNSAGPYGGCITPKIRALQTPQSRKTPPGE